MSLNHFHPTGLSCANWLKDSGIDDVLVLEARDRVGGRTLTKRDPCVSWVDLGGAYVGPTQDYILRQIKNLGLKTYKVNEDGQQVFYYKVRHHDHICFRMFIPEIQDKRITYGKDADIPYLGVKAHIELNNLFQLLDKVGDEVRNYLSFSS